MSEGIVFNVFNLSLFFTPSRRGSWSILGVSIKLLRAAQRQLI